MISHRASQLIREQDNIMQHISTAMDDMLATLKRRDPFNIDDRFSNEDEARTRFANTPCIDPAEIPFGFDSAVHIGQGVWLHKCRECEEFRLTWGTAPRYATIGQHEAKEHGALVAGYNVGMLA